jgi:hypothetical protein
VALTYFFRCAACDREVRVFDSRLGTKLTPGGKLPEDGALQDADGTFACPHCGERQSLPDDAWRV